MISAVFQTALLNLRRDRAALLLSFVVPVTFFSIFAAIFSGNAKREATPKVSIAVADEDHSEVSKRFIQALQANPSLEVHLTLAAEKGRTPRLFDSSAAETPTCTMDSDVNPLLPKVLSGQGTCVASVVTILRGSAKGSESSASTTTGKGS